MSRSTVHLPALSAALLLVLPSMALAHSTEHGDSLWRAWSLDPWVSIPLAIAGLLHVIGLWRLARRGHSGRRARWRDALLFWLGWLASVLALLSPLDALGDQLFSAHMVQHEVLMLVAAPLLVLGKPLPIWLWALPGPWRPGIGGATRTRMWSSLWSACTRPLAAWIIHAVMLWIWHAPALFQAAVGDNFVHTLQHLSFMGSALLFWWAMFDPRHGMVRPAIGALYIFTTAIHTSVLGALLTFSSSVWYPVYADRAPAWGLSALDDQQLGGLIMWVPGGAVYLVVTLWLLARLLAEPDKAPTRQSHHG